jgi:hypothetical protein
MSFLNSKRKAAICFLYVWGRDSMFVWYIMLLNVRLIMPFSRFSKFIRYIFFAIAITGKTGCWWQVKNFHVGIDYTRLIKVFRGLQADTWVTFMREDVEKMFRWLCIEQDLPLNWVIKVSESDFFHLWSTVIHHRQGIKRCNTTLETWRTSQPCPYCWPGLSLLGQLLCTCAAIIFSMSRKFYTADAWRRW